MEELLVSQLVELNCQKQYRSAEYIASVIIRNGSIKVPILVQYAEALHGLGEYRRATKYCAQIIEALSDSPTDHAPILLLAADCHANLKNYKVSFQLYKRVPYSHHSLKSLMSMARVSLIADTENTAILLFQEVLKRYPFCIEAVTELIALNAFPGNMFAKNSSITPPLDVVASKKINQFVWNWYSSIAINLYNISKGLPANPINIETEDSGDSKLFSVNDSKDLLHLRARASAAIRKSAFYEAISIFDSILAIDKDSCEDMHLYAYALKRTRPDVNVMRNIIHTMLHMAPHRATTWIIVAIWYDLKRKRDIALQHVHRAIALDPRVWLAYLVRGELYQSINDHANALRSVRQSWSLSKSLCVGELYASLSLQADPNNVVAHALEIYKHTGGNNSARSLAIMGRAYATDPKSYSLARKYLDRALNIDEACPMIYIALAHIHQHASSATYVPPSEQANTAIETLKKGIVKCPCEALYMELGELYLKLDKLHDAMHNFTLVLQQNPLNEAASNFLEQAYMLIRGSIDSDVHGGEDDYLGQEG